MSASLVGSEMCIRDSVLACSRAAFCRRARRALSASRFESRGARCKHHGVKRRVSQQCLPTVVPSMPAACAIANSFMQLVSIFSNASE
eukprot:11621923-Alexandrium_andersonii.AAC.1